MNSLFVFLHQVVQKVREENTLFSNNITSLQDKISDYFHINVIKNSNNKSKMKIIFCLMEKHQCSVKNPSKSTNLGTKTKERVPKIKVLTEIRVH